MYHGQVLHAFGDYAAISLQGSMDSFASAAERQGSFTTQASSRADSFHDAHSRRDSFASASGSLAAVLTLPSTFLLRFTSAVGCSSCSRLKRCRSGVWQRKVTACHSCGFAVWRLRHAANMQIGQSLFSPVSCMSALYEWWFWHAMIELATQV